MLLILCHSQKGGNWIIRTKLSSFSLYKNLKTMKTKYKKPSTLTISSNYMVLEKPLTILVHMYFLWNENMELDDLLGVP